MKNVTFIIGNGFDIKLGLKTRYSDFYKIYKKIPNPNATIMNFKKNILNDNEQRWRDFELGMGQCEKFNSPEDYIACYQDFASKLNDYLLKENERLNLNNISQKNQNEFNNSLYYFYNKLQSVEFDKIKSLHTEAGQLRIALNVIQLNYTNTFDKLYEALIPANYYCEKGKCLHAHGQIGGGNHAMGVNDISQIKDQMLKNDSIVANTFVKTAFHKLLQNKNVNKKTDYSKAQDIIKSTQTFCIFGCSIGDTDKFWWQQIGQCLSKHANTHLIIFDVCEIDTENEGLNQLTLVLNSQKEDEKRKAIIQNFLKQSDLGEDWAEKNEGRIFVELNTNMFDIHIPEIKEKNKLVEIEDIPSFLQ